VSQRAARPRPRARSRPGRRDRRGINAQRSRVRRRGHGTAGVTPPYGAGRGGITGSGGSTAAGGHARPAGGAAGGAGGGGADAVSEYDRVTVRETQMRLAAVEAVVTRIETAVGEHVTWHRDSMTVSRYQRMATALSVAALAVSMLAAAAAVVTLAFMSSGAAG